MSAGGPVVFFDGVCGLCNKVVDVLLTADTAGVLRFAPLQGPTAAAQLPNTLATTLDTVVLLDGGQVYVRSEAALRIAAKLGGFWGVLGVFWLVPRGVRDAVYDFIARHRATWFGTRDTCRLPTPAERTRFLP